MAPGRKGKHETRSDEQLLRVDLECVYGMSRQKKFQETRRKALGVCYLFSLFYVALKSRTLLL